MVRTRGTPTEHSACSGRVLRKSINMLMGILFLSISSMGMASGGLSPQTITLLKQAQDLLQQGEGMRAQSVLEQVRSLAPLEALPAWARQQPSSRVQSPKKPSREEILAAARVDPIAHKPALEEVLRETPQDTETRRMLLEIAMSENQEAEIRRHSSALGIEQPARVSKVRVLLLLVGCGLILWLFWDILRLLRRPGD